MARFLVTGASGFIGHHLVSALRQRGNSVKQAVRRHPRSINSLLDEILVVGDIGPDTNWDVALNEVDVVVHLAAHVHVLNDKASDSSREYNNTNVLGTEWLAKRAAAKGIRRFIYMSSIGVNGYQSGITPFTERDKPSPFDAYTYSKWEAERILKTVADKTGLEIVILRPPLVYGPGNPGNFLRLLNLVWSGWPLPLRSFRNLRSLIYVGNLVDATIHCATHPNAAGNTYLVSDGEDISMSDLLNRLTKLMGRSSRLFSFPPLILNWLAKGIGRSTDIDRLINTLLLDDSHIRTLLDWNPPYSLMDGLRETVSWFVAQRTSRDLIK